MGHIIPLRIIPDNTKIDFMGKKKYGFALSFLIIASTIFLLFSKGLNFGIDFTGGILVEARFEKTPNLQSLRESFKEENIGDVSLQNLGDENTLLIRVGQAEDNESERQRAVTVIKNTIDKGNYGNIDYRKVDYVGPKVGQELIYSGGMAILMSFVAIMIYVAFRFEWQYGVGAILALVHDAIATIGFYSLTGLEFNLSSIAAILTIIGYSINDSVVVYDRVRENMRRFKKMEISELLNLSLNETLARTFMTSSTTIVAILALTLVGGDVIKSFSTASLFGICVGTFSSVYVSVPVLVYFNLRKAEKKEEDK